MSTAPDLAKATASLATLLKAGSVAHYDHHLRCRIDPDLAYKYARRCWAEPAMTGLAATLAATEEGAAIIAAEAHAWTERGHLPPWAPQERP